MGVRSRVLSGCTVKKGDQCYQSHSKTCMVIWAPLAGHLSSAPLFCLFSKGGEAATNRRQLPIGRRRELTLRASMVHVIYCRSETLHRFIKFIHIRADKWP